jgi:hypothetical protein
MTPEDIEHAAARAQAEGEQRIREGLPQNAGRNNNPLSKIKNKAMYNASNQISNYNAIVEKNDGKRYHDIVLENYRKDPNGHQAMLNEAHALGKLNADQFMEKVRNWEKPGHEEALSEYHSSHGGNRDNVEKHYVKKAQELLNVKPVEYRNLAYEDKVLNNRAYTNEDGAVIRKPLDVIRNADDQAVISKYKALMTAKHKAVGYEGDDNEIANYWQAHKLSDSVPA